MGAGASSKTDGPAEAKIPYFYLQGMTTMKEKREVIMEVLNNEKELGELEEFLKKEFADELVAFVVAAQGYARSAPDADMPTRFSNASKIFDEFVKQGSARQINVSGKVLKTATKELKALESAAGPEGPGDDPDLGKNLFEKLQSDIVDLMAKDKLRRFSEVRRSVCSEAEIKAMLKDAMEQGLITQPAQSLML
jgi:hypothetical protein